MRWNLRLAAAHRGIWKASELQAKLAEHGLVISAGEDVRMVVGPPGQPQARGPRRSVRRAGLRCRRIADPRAGHGVPISP